VDFSARLGCVDMIACILTAIGILVVSIAAALLFLFAAHRNRWLDRTPMGWLVLGCALWILLSLGLSYMAFRFGRLHARERRESRQE